MSISTLSPSSERSPGGEPELAPLPWPERPAPQARFERRRPVVSAPEPFAPPPFEAAWGDPSEALSRWRTSVTLSEALSEQRPDNMTWQRDVLRARRRIARAQLALGAFDEASATCEQAIERAERAREVDPSHLEVLEEAAALHETLGWAHGAAGRVRQAAAALREALAAWLRRARLLPDPDERPALQGLLVNCRRIARALARLGDAGGAARAWDEALRCAQALAAAADAQHPDRETLADMLAARGDALRRAGRLADALESYREALAVLERAVAAGAEPDALAERRHGVQQRIAAALAESGRPAEAAAQHRAALAVATRQAALAPGALHWQRAVAESHAGLAAALRAVGDREQAEAALRAALLARRSAYRASGSLEDLRALVALQLETGDALWDAGDRPAAEAAYRAARTLCEDERTALVRPWSIVHERLGDLALEDDRLEAAQASYDEAWTSWRLTSGPLRDRDEPALRERRAWLRLRQGRLEEAEREARTARALRERAVGADESEAGERALFLAELLLGEVLEAAGRLPEAHAAYEAATAIAARRCSEGAYRPEARRELSIAAERCGATLEAQGDLAAALAAYERAAVLREAIAEREDAGAQALADRAEIELRVGALLLARGDEAAALARHEQAVSLYERALRTGADGVPWLGASALAAARLARVRERRGEFEAALAANAQALERLEALRAAGRGETRWRAVRRLVLGDRGRLRAVRDGRADSPRRALELRLQRDAPRFELLALLRVLHRLGYDEDSIVYRS
ncbi:MAG: hypothetical protein D6776_07015, partial [Planctomycetota bacterium]